MFRDFYFSNNFSVKAWKYSILVVIFNLSYSILQLRVTSWFSEIYNLLVKSFNSKDDATIIQDVKEKMLHLPMYLVYLSTLRVLSSYFLISLLLSWRRYKTKYFFDNWGYIKKIEGVSQRIQEDLLQIVRLVERLFFRIVISISRAIVHIPVLIQMSHKVGGIPPFSPDFKFSLITYLLVSTSISLLIIYMSSKDLSSKIMKKEITEASFRKKLIISEDSLPAFDYHHIMDNLIQELSMIHGDIYFNLLKYDLTSGILHEMIRFLPTILLIPAIIRKDITVGGRATIIRCFDTVRSGVTCIFFNWDDISELITALKRLNSLEFSISKKKEELLINSFHYQI